MKKETAIKKITGLHNQFFDIVQKLRDYVYTIDDPELCEQIDEWCDNFEEYLEDGGSLDPIIESIEEIFIEEE